MRNTRNVCVTSSVRRPEEGRGRLRVSEKRREGKKSNPKKKESPTKRKRSALEARLWLATATKGTMMRLSARKRLSDFHLFLFFSFSFLSAQAKKTSVPPAEKASRHIAFNKKEMPKN